MSRLKASSPEAHSSTGTFLRGQRVNLRGLRRDDMEHVRRWWDNAEATQYMETGARPATEPMLEAFYKSATENPNVVVFVVEDADTGQPIGTSGLFEIFWPGRRAEFRILIGEPSTFDKGYGTEATRMTVAYGFSRLNMEVIHLGVNASNARAVRAYEKAGFVKEGLRRKFVFARGVYHDAVVMSILREEYLATGKP
jgi:RimJ/RimL family protein N-acetyltransferase